jgi:nitrate reductase beta subunit
MMPDGAAFDPEAFHAPPPAGASGTSTSLRGRVNLLNWNGKGRPDGLFPRARRSVRTEPEL